MTDSFRFRISGSSKVMTLHCDLRIKLRPYFQRRNIPWSIYGDAVFSWLTRADLYLNGWDHADSPDRAGSDGGKLFFFLTGVNPKTIPANRGDLHETYDSVKSYQDLPLADEKHTNKYLHWVAYRNAYELSTAKNNVILNNLYNDICDINDAQSISPDDNCALDDLLNDKKNLRGRQYLEFMFHCKTPLVLPGASSPFPALSIAERTACEAALAHPVRQFKIAQSVMYARGIVDY